MSEKYQFENPVSNVRPDPKVLARIQISAPENDTNDHITISIGVARQTGISLDKNLLFKHADTALYEAKNSGKNKIEMFNAETDHE